MAAFEGVLKLAALVDLARRPAAEVRGSKVKWAMAIVLINSAGLVPIGYFVRGRRPGLRLIAKLGQRARSLALHVAQA